MDLKKLSGFRAIAKHGNLRRAAADQGLTLAAISIQVKKLEQELDAKLFDRRLNRLTLTDQGRAFLQEVNLAFDVLERAKLSLTHQTTDYIGSVSVSLATDIAKFFAPGIAAFTKQHPRLNVAILARPSRESMALVLNGEIDIGVGFFRKVPRGITTTKLSDTVFSLVLTKDHPLAKHKRPSLSDIAEHRVVMPRRSSPTGQMIDSTYSNQGIGLPNIVEVERCQSTMDFVEQGLGVGFVHHVCACAERHNDLLQVDMSRYFGKTDIAIITRSNAAFGPAQEAFVDTLLEGAEVIRQAQAKD
jgi:DNA-binding transcriptional LysR family regulator